MRGLHDTISRLKAFPKRAHAGAEPLNHRLARLKDFGSNPGGLRGWTHIPAGLPQNAPLVVVLHGCTQTAAGYDLGAGWSAAADRDGFAVIFPEQQRVNNSNLCFNWFVPEQASRGSGEALSIRQMVAAVQRSHGTDPERVFVTGLSAGGAMAAVMLATYPEVFAGGAIVAGLPFGTAHSVPEAFERMRDHAGVPPEALAQLVRSASDYSGPWPRVSVWHGTSDRTVDVSNAGAVVDQWRTLHGSPSAPCRLDMVNEYSHRVWCDAAGREVVEEYLITGLGHGTPLNTSEARLGETAGPYMLEAGISSTQHSLAFWGIESGAAESAVPARSDKDAGEVPVPRLCSIEAERLHKPPEAPASRVQKTIEDALRAAGLLDR